MTIHEIESRISMLEQLIEAQRLAREEGRWDPSLNNPSGRPASMDLMELYKLLSQKTRELRAGNERPDPA